MYNDLDHALWLHPAPDALIVADRTSQFSLTFDDTLAVNPGHFGVDACWVVYRPATREAEPSSLPKESMSQ